MIGGNPIFLASSNNNLELVRFFISAGAKTNIVSSIGRSPLIQSIIGNHQLHVPDFELVKLLVEEGENPLFSDEHSLTAIDYAKEKGYIDIMQYLENKVSNN
jgi:ankyrin repeat protein